MFIHILFKPKSKLLFKICSYYKFFQSVYISKVKCRTIGKTIPTLLENLNQELDFCMHGADLRIVWTNVRLRYRFFPRLKARSKAYFLGVDASAGAINVK